MPSYDVGDMFWGKSQSYPWWPCIIMENNNNEIKRTRKKTGTQYHVQFIGPNYDACWITNNFLIEYNGTENFESYVENQLRSSLPPQHKLIYEMKMTGQIQAMWIQACQDAEKIHLLSNEERTHRLPKLDNFVLGAGKKQKLRKRPLKTVSKVSDSSSVSDTISVDTKCVVLDTDDTTMKDTILSADIEDICRRVYMAEETENRTKSLTGSSDQIEIENLIKEQWDVLDVETKLLYLNVEKLNTSKSRVSGRKIKVPSRLRRTNELENIKKAALKKRNSETQIEKKKSNSMETASNVSVSNCEELSQPASIPSSSLPLNQVYREIVDSALLDTIEIQDSSMEIMKLIVDNCSPDVQPCCYQCFKPFKFGDKNKHCKSGCGASYHLMCALNGKLFRADEGNRCVNCVTKEYLCCICKNSKYMKKQFLVKCQKPNCSFYFHATCSKYLHFIESASDEKDMVFCPNHSCLTCCREDSKHSCNTLGPFVTCIKCPISYHDNLLCIPAGCRMISPQKIICHRHFENSCSSTNKLTRCFVCFKDNATLNCCRCRAVFHPKCMHMATYTDLLKDYVCPTCKLEQPMFYGQIIWTEIASLWTPAEIVFPSRIPENESHLYQKSITLRTIHNKQYNSVDRCQLIPFIIGESVLKDLIVPDKKVVECARKMHFVYLNWLKRMRPFQSEYFPIIGQYELKQLSTVSLGETNTDSKYENIKRNEYDENIKMKIPQMSPIICSCTSNYGVCASDKCSNYINKIECNQDICTIKGCKNRKFASGFNYRPIVTDIGVIHGLGVKITEKISKGELFGECTGRIISLDSVFELMDNQSVLNGAYYIFNLLGDVYLNCQQQGNEWRHLNHSCDPNAELVCWYVAGELKLGVSSLRPISNEEVTINYQKSGLVLKYSFVCNCQAQNCLKAIGPTSIFASQTNLIVPHCCVVNKVIDETSIVSQSKETKFQQVKAQVILPVLQIKSAVKSELAFLSNINVDEKINCHRCGNIGELITCCKTNCNKRYHLQCVELSKAPKGLWFCPKHYCVKCCQAATVFCNDCSTSHCKSHTRYQKKHSCRKYTVYDEPVLIKIANEDCETIEKTRKSETISLLPALKETENNVEIYIESSGSVINNNAKVKKPEVSSIDKPESEEATLPKSVEPDQISSSVINKKDLYSACDLVPIDNSKESVLSANSNSNSPSQVNLTIKRKSELDVSNSTDKVKKPKLIRNVSCNISNYTSSTDEEIEAIPESVDDSNDIRSQVNPMGIEDMENLIISPTVLDD